MKKEVYSAAVRGDTTFLREAQRMDIESITASYYKDDFLALTTGEGNNILHVAALYGQLDFIKEALATFSVADKKLVICQVNLNGDTPLHLGAKQSTKSIAELLVESYRLLLSNDDIRENVPVPWMVRNNKGNTPLHVALINGGKSIQVAAYLLDIIT
ncbi:Ankyrin repeat domain-containing protein 27 [Bienertia sinuspersici]